MSMWTEQEQASRSPLEVSAERARELDEAKRDALPHVLAEGDRPFDRIHFQPVISPGIYEAEFALKGPDIIFHFWPYGFRKAIEQGKARPAFKTAFKPILEKILHGTFTEHRTKMDFDRDIGSWFVKVSGWGDHQFARELAIKACEMVHLELGGEKPSQS